MDQFMNSFNASAGAFNRREADIRGINEAGVENYNTQKAAQQANYNALKGQVGAANQAVKTQTGIEEGFAGVGMEPLVKSGLDYGAKSLYAAGKQAKAARLTTRAQALQEGDTAAASEAENPGMLEQAADVMDSELAQNIAAVAKAPGELVGRATQAVGDIGKAVYRGGQRVVQNIKASTRTRGDATEQEGTELQEQAPTEPATGETSFGTEAVEAPRGNIPQQQLARNTTVEQPVEDLPAQGGVRSGQAVETRTLEQAGADAEEQSNTLVSASGQEVGEVAAGETTSAAEAAAAPAAAGAGEAAAAGAGAEAGADAAATAATAATEAGIDAAAAASEAVPGVGTVVGGLLALGGAIFAGIEGSKHHSSTPPAPKPPPKPTAMGINIAEASPVLDSSIYRATGYNQLA